MSAKPKYPTLNYIGNKAKMVDWICDSIPRDVRSVFDAFSGGASVAYAAKERGYQVYCNDIIKINYNIAKALIENSADRLTPSDVDQIFSGEPLRGFMFDNYADVFYYPEECMELDQYRSNIMALSNENKVALAFVLMRRAMVRKMPYSRFTIPWEKIKQLRDEEYSYEKYKRRRAYHNETFKHHFLQSLEQYNNAVFDSGKVCMAFNDDIYDAVDYVEADLIYLDPPYAGTMNDYFRFYGVMDEYIEGRRLPPFENNFVDKKTVLELFDRLFSKLGKYKYWLLSYNNASYPSKDQMIELLSTYGESVELFERPHVYKITGKEKKKDNREYLFLVKNNQEP